MLITYKTKKRYFPIEWAGRHKLNQVNVISTETNQNHVPTEENAIIMKQPHFQDVSAKDA